MSRAGQGVADGAFVAGGAQQQPDGRGVMLEADLAVDGGDVEVELADVGRGQLGGLQLEDQVAAGRDVEHQQVDEELVAVELEAPLAADEREPGAELEQEPFDLRHEGPLEVAFGDAAVRVRNSRL